jgi:hypothetical protein
MFRGFTIWLDEEGGEEKRFDIQFPLGIQMGAFPPPGRDWNRERTPEDTLRDRFPIDTTEVKIIGPMEHEHHRESVFKLKQIAVKINMVNGTMVYELRVPLMDNGPESICY